MTFSDIIGHENVKNRLIHSAEAGKVSHAYIFCGKKGIGKTVTAYAFADLLTCGSVADVTVVTNEKYGIKTSALSVEAVRAARTEMYTKPYNSEKRVFIFPAADTMTIAAQNALLKVFEEPPSYCVIILITQNENILLQTIRSRAMTLRFSPLNDDDVKSYLSQKNIKFTDIIIKLAGGSIQTAEALATDEDLSSVVSNFAVLFKKILQPSRVAIYELINFFDKQKAYSGTLFDAILAMFRETLLNSEKNCDTIALDGVSKGSAAIAISLIEKSKGALLYNANYSMVVSELLLNLWEAVHD